MPQLPVPFMEMMSQGTIPPTSAPRQAPGWAYKPDNGNMPEVEHFAGHFGGGVPQFGDLPQFGFRVDGGGSLRVSKNHSALLAIDTQKAQGHDSERLPVIAEPAPQGGHTGHRPSSATSAPASPPNPHGSYRNLPKGFDPFPRIPPHLLARAQSAAGHTGTYHARIHTNLPVATGHANGGPSRGALSALFPLEDPPMTADSRVPSEYWTARSGLSSRENTPPQDAALSPVRECDGTSAGISVASDTRTQSPSAPVEPRSRTLNPRAIPFFTLENGSQVTDSTMAESPKRDTIPAASTSRLEVAAPVIVRTPNPNGPAKPPLPHLAAGGPPVHHGGSQGNNGQHEIENKGKEKVAPMTRARNNTRSDPAFKNEIMTSLRPAYPTTQMAVGRRPDRKADSDFQDSFVGPSKKRKGKKNNGNGGLDERRGG